MWPGDGEVLSVLTLSQLWPSLSPQLSSKTQQLGDRAWSRHEAGLHPRTTTSASGKLLTLSLSFLQTGSWWTVDFWVGVAGMEDDYTGLR